jgi:hypothetical protein
MRLAPAVGSYLDRVLAAAERGLGRPLVAGAVVGSVANGDVAGEASDLDLLLVVERPPDAAALRGAGERLADLAADCPLRGLELVVYRRDVLARPRHPLPYLLNVNGGRVIARLVSTGGDPGFWFLLDVAAAREHALALTGPPLPELIGPVPRPAVLAALRESLDWHDRHGGHGPDPVLNACRALHWLERGTWLSKTAAGEWIAQQPGAPAIVGAALARRREGSDADLDATGVGSFLAAVRLAVERADAGEQPSVPPAGRSNASSATHRPLG